MGAGAAQGTWTETMGADVVHRIWRMGAGAAQETWTETMGADVVHETATMPLNTVDCLPST